MGTNNDGIDSNSTLTISGGLVIASGTTTTAAWAAVQAQADSPVAAIMVSPVAHAFNDAAPADSIKKDSVAVET